MIEAYFEIDGSDPIPALIPDAEVLEIARMAGIPPSELFGIDIPAGASREGRVRCLVASSALDRLYNNASVNGNQATARFSWRSSENDTLMQLDVWLLPPKPIFMVYGSEGIALVEAVDVRYWWKRQQGTTLTNSPSFAHLFSSDGRWRTGYQTGIGTCIELLQSMRDLLGVGTFSTTGYAPSAVLWSRLADQVWTPEVSLAMAIDLVLSLTGYVLVYNLRTMQYEVKLIEDERTILDTLMQDFRNAVGAGLEAPSTATATPTDVLLRKWQGNDEWQLNRMPPSVTVSHPFRRVEGKTYYDNNGTFPMGAIPFSDAREYGVSRPIPTQRSRQDIAADLVLKEPRAILGNDTPWPFTSTTPSSNILGYTSSVPPSWNVSAYAGEVRNLIVNRCAMPIGKVVWGGWILFPVGVFRGSICRFYLGERNGECVPLSMTECEERDWIFGPDGLQPDTPREIVLGKGIIHARRLGSGIVHLDAAPPNTRTFPALILSSTRDGVSGNAYWRWTYAFEEVEPVGTGSPVSIGTLARTGNARNMVEQGNLFYSAGDSRNMISTGVAQADYANATIDALPVVAGTVVLMVEQFPTSKVPSSPTDLIPYGRQYWFALPNAVKVTCGNPFVANDDYGTFADPAAIDTECGFFDAPEADLDYGWFTDDLGSFAVPSALVFDYGSIDLAVGTADYGVF